MTLIWPTRLGPGLRRFCRPRGRAGDLALPTFVPSSTPSFTFCGQAANGDYCHANFHLGARSTITFRPGKMPVCGFIYTACSTSRPVAMRVERPGPSVVIVDGQSVKTTERGGTRGFKHPLSPNRSIPFSASRVPRSCHCSSSDLVEIALNPSSNDPPPSRSGRRFS